MADIVERLHIYAADVMPSYPNDICSQAADEIERMRAALERIRDFPGIDAQASHAIVSIARDGLGEHSNG